MVREGLILVLLVLQIVNVRQKIEMLFIKQLIIVFQNGGMTEQNYFK